MEILPKAAVHRNMKLKMIAMSQGKCIGSIEYKVFVNRSKSHECESCQCDPCAKKVSCNIKGHLNYI